MNFEILGLSGVGKTTITLECLSKNREFNKLVTIHSSSRVSQLKSIIFALNILIRITCRSFKSASYLATSKVGLRLLLRLGSRCLLIKKSHKNKNTLLVDSGVLMPFVESVMVDDLLWSEPLLRAVISCLPLPDAVLYIYTTQDLSYKRFLNRAKTKYSYAGKMDGIFISVDKFNNANKCLNFLLNYLKSESKIIISYKNEGQINCEEVINKFNKLLR